MDKKLISEITRLHQLMGVKNSSLIIESVGCPFCSSIIRQVDNFVDLMRRGGIDQIEFKLKLNELTLSVAASPILIPELNSI
jgi:hypothetical protein